MVSRKEPTPCHDFGRAAAAGTYPSIRPLDVPVKPHPLPLYQGRSVVESRIFGIMVWDAPRRGGAGGRGNFHGRSVSSRRCGGGGSGPMDAGRAAVR